MILYTVTGRFQYVLKSLNLYINVTSKKIKHALKKWKCLMETFLLKASSQSYVYVNADVNL